MKARILFLLALVAAGVSVPGCAQPNRLVGTWTIVGTDPSVPSVLVVRKLVIADNSIEEFMGEKQTGTTLPLTILNDHTATMAGLFGAVISLQLNESGELHLTDPDSRFRRSN